MSAPASSLFLAVYPPAIDVSTAENKQIFAAQFSVANLSGTESVRIARALLLVPVCSKGTNLASNADLAPSPSTPGWTFQATSSPTPGYAAFMLLPNDGMGAIAPGRSVAFTLSNVEVSSGPPGDAALPFEAKTSLGTWTTDAEIELTTPSTTPTITRYSVTPADDPNSPTALQGQSVIISWTSTGAAYCTIVDDQGNTWLNLHTGGTISDTPALGESTIHSDPELGPYYRRTYTLTAYAAGAQTSDQKPNSAIIQLPTILSFAVSPAAIGQVGDTVTVSWSVSGVDADKGAIPLTLAPTDGTGPYTIDVPASQTRGTAVVTPTPLTTTAYSLAAHNGYGFSAPGWSSTVASTLASGFVPMNGLWTLTNTPIHTQPWTQMSLAAFAGRLWCAYSTSASLYATADGSGWTAVTPRPALPPIDGLVVVRAESGVETLWAFGGDATTPFVASSADGQNWTMLPTPPYPARIYAGYAVNAGRLYVAGGHTPDLVTVLQDVWSSTDGVSWVNEGEHYGSNSQSGPLPLAAFAGELWTYTSDGADTSWPTRSSNGGATWQQAPALMMPVYTGCALEPVGDRLWLLGAGGTLGAGAAIVATDSTGSLIKTKVAVQLPTGGTNAVSACVFSGWVWLGSMPWNDQLSTNPQFFLLNQVLPGTTFTLAPPGEGACE